MYVLVLYLHRSTGSWTESKYVYLTGTKHVCKYDCQHKSFCSSRTDTDSHTLTISLIFHSVSQSKFTIKQQDWMCRPKHKPWWTDRQATGQPDTQPIGQRQIERQTDKLLNFVRCGSEFDLWSSICTGAGVWLPLLAFILLQSPWVRDSLEAVRHSP